MTTFTHATMGYVSETEQWVQIRKHKSVGAAEALIATLTRRKEGVSRGFRRPKATFFASCFPYVPVEFKIVELEEK